MGNSKSHPSWSPRMTQAGLSCWASLLSVKALPGSIWPGPPLSPKCLLSVCCGPRTKLNISAHGACMLLGGTGGEEEPSLRPSSRSGG